MIGQALQIVGVVILAWYTLMLCFFRREFKTLDRPYNLLVVYPLVIYGWTMLSALLYMQFIFIYVPLLILVHTYLLLIYLVLTKKVRELELKDMYIVFGLTGVFATVLEIYKVYNILAFLNG